ncbi:MAG: TolC family protein [bacterium]
MPNAVADIANVEAQIQDREQELAAKIRQGKGEVEKQRSQLLTANEILQSRKQIYELKLKGYRAGTESIDNLLQAFRSLVDTETDLHDLVNDYFDNIRDLDFLCGVYFEKLGIEVK